MSNQTINRSGRFFEIISVDVPVTINSTPGFGGFYGVDLGANYSDNRVNISGEYLMLDSGSETAVIVGLEFPGAPSIGYLTMNPGDFIRQPYLSVRIVGARSSGDIRFQHGRGDFEISPVGGGSSSPSYSGVTTVIASDGVALPYSSLAQTYIFTGTDLTSVTVSYLGNLYRQSYTYSGGNIATQSQWVKL